MTRDRGPVTRLQYRTFGAAHAARAVVVLREGAAATLDPDPEITAAYDVRVIAVRLWPRETEDPGAYGGETLAMTTVTALQEFLFEQRAEDDDGVGLVGAGDAGSVAVLLAGRCSEFVDRLALVGVPRPAAPLERDIAARSLAEISLPTLVLAAHGDPVATPADAAWHRDRLRNASVEYVDRTARSLDARLSVTDAWRRVLGHVAPGAG